MYNIILESRNGRERDKHILQLRIFNVLEEKKRTQCIIIQTRAPSLSLEAVPKFSTNQQNNLHTCKMTLQQIFCLHLEN